MSNDTQLNYLLSLILAFASTFGFYHSSEHLAPHSHEVMGVYGQRFVYQHAESHPGASGAGDHLDSYCGICSLLSSGGCALPQMGCLRAVGRSHSVTGFQFSWFYTLPSSSESIRAPPSLT